MADYTLSGNTNYSSLSPAPTINDRVVLNGYTLTIDVSTVYCYEISAVGNAGKIVNSSASNSITFNGVGANSNRTLLKAGSVVLFADASNSTATIYNAAFVGGGSSNAYAISTAYSTFDNCSFTGGSGAYAVNNNNGVIRNGAITGSVIGAGIVGINANFNVISNTAITSGGASLSCGLTSNYGRLIGCTFRLGSAGSAALSFNNGVTSGCTFIGGASGYHATNYNYGAHLACAAISASSSGAYAVYNNYGLVEVNPANVTGGGVRTSVAGCPSLLRIPDGSSAAGIVTGAYVVEYWPVAGDIRSGKPSSGSPALGSVGVMPAGGGLLVNPGLGGGLR